MIVLRRFLMLQLLLVWQGGFLFYAAVVVPTGTEVLRSPATQGAITARVTDALNLIGVVGLAMACLEVSLTRDPTRWRTAIRWWCCSLAIVCQFLLFLFHHLLDSFMDPQRTHVVIGPPFYPVHRMYLWAATMQWAACVVLVGLMVQAWRAEDARQTESQV